MVLLLRGWPLSPLFPGQGLCISITIPTTLSCRELLHPVFYFPFFIESLMATTYFFVLSTSTTDYGDEIVIAALVILEAYPVRAAPRLAVCAFLVLF